MTKITLYYIAGSPPARAVLMLLQHMDMDYELKTLDLSKREQFKPEYLKINPNHQVPTLVDGDFVLTESRAMLQYLVNSRKPGCDLYPSDPKLRARVDQRLSYDNVLFFRNQAVIVSCIIIKLNPKFKQTFKLLATSLLPWEPGRSAKVSRRRQRRFRNHRSLLVRDEVDRQRQLNNRRLLVTSSCHKYCWVWLRLIEAQARPALVQAVPRTERIRWKCAWWSWTGRSS